MLKKYAQTLNLGAFSEKRKESLKKDFDYKKEFNRILKNSRESAKLGYCYCCEKKVSGFCNSHSLPAFCLRKVSLNGNVCTLNSLVENPLIEDEKGVNKSGTFHMICNTCDGLLFSDYENPSNYANEPTQKMLKQIALKNSLKLISKRLMEIQLFSQPEFQKDPSKKALCDFKNTINRLDLKEFTYNFQKAKKCLEKNSNDYYLCYYRKLNYVVPIAFQSPITIQFDFEGNIINNIYNPSPTYQTKDINICILPLENESVIFMFIENNDKRYRKFYKQFNKLPKDEQLKALIFIIFAYSEEVYFSPTIKEELLKNTDLCEFAKKGSDIISFDPFCNAIDVAKEEFDLNNRYKVPNLLDEKYKLD